MKINCCNKFMDMLRAAYDMATHAIKGVQLGSDPEIKYPDGAGIVKLNVPDAQSLDEIEAYIEVSRATDERLSLDIERLDTAKQDTLIAGANIVISADNVISATGGGGSGSDFTAQNNDGSIMFYKDGVKQAELTEGANITISADGVISATGGGTGGTPTADEVLLSDGRSVQDGIDSIEDELGDLGTSGTVQSRLEALETSDTSQDADITNLENKATEFDGRLGSLSQAIGACVDDFTIDKSIVGKVGITMDKIDGMTSQSADIIKASTGIRIVNGFISATGDGWEEVDLLNWDGDWEVGDEFRIIFKVRLSFESISSWTSRISDISILSSNYDSGIVFNGSISKGQEHQTTAQTIIAGSVGASAVRLINVNSVSGDAAFQSTDTTTKLFRLGGVTFNGSYAKQATLDITVGNIANYVYKMWRRRP